MKDTTDLAKAYKLYWEFDISLPAALELLEVSGLSYDLVYSNLIALKVPKRKDKKIMTMEDKIELFLLETVLKDSLYCTQLRPETLGKLFVRRRVLLDQFVQQYELPNSINDPIKD